MKMSKKTSDSKVGHKRSPRGGTSTALARVEPNDPPQYPIRWFDMTIMGTLWHVVLSTADETKELRNGIEGRCVYQTSTIFIKASLPKTRRWDVLTHEVLHAVIYMSGFDKILAQIHQGVVPLEDREELLVSTLGASLHDTLARNGFIRYPDDPT